MVASTRASAFVIVSAIAVFLGACSRGADDAGTVQKVENPVQFSAADKRIAAKLSIGENQLEKVETPLDRALICDVALAALEERLRDSGILDAAQQTMLASLRQRYRNDARIAGGATADLDAAQENVKNTYPDESERARLAVSCLRQSLS